MVTASMIIIGALLSILVDEGGHIERELEGKPDEVAWDLVGSYAIYGTMLDEMLVDADGAPWGQDYLVEHRLRLQPQASFFGNLRVEADLQLASGYLAVDQPSPEFAGFGPLRDRRAAAFGRDQRYVHQLALRTLYLSWRTPVGLLLLGRMTSMWGEGILANSGDDNFDQDWGAPRFGEDRNFGDVSNRVLFATTPFAALSEGVWARRLAVAGAFDLIQHDDLTNLARGDVGLQGIGIVRYAVDPHNELGMYVAYRDTRDRNDEVLRVWAYDMAGKVSHRVGDARLYGAFEVAYLAGTTSLGRVSGTDPWLGIQQLGGVARVGTSYEPWGAAFDVELGYASGDSNPFDSHLRNFAFDPNYRPSLIMFRELQAAQTLAAAAHASHPSRVGQASTAARYLPTDGGMTNAIYLRPTLRYHFGGLVKGLSARAAGLWARAEDDVVDPFNTTAAGSRQNFRGGDSAARDYGFELDVGIDYTHRVGQRFEWTSSLQVGRLWPGRAFGDATGRAPEPVHAGFLRVAARWLPQE